MRGIKGSILNDIYYSDYEFLSKTIVGDVAEVYQISSKNTGLLNIKTMQFTFKNIDKQIIALSGFGVIEVQGDKEEYDITVSKDNNSYIKKIKTNIPTIIDLYSGDNSVTCDGYLIDHSNIITNRENGDYYDLSDVLRVSALTKVLNIMLKTNGYVSELNNNILTWNYGDYPSSSEIEDFLQNVKNLKNVFGTNVKLTLPSSIYNAIIEDFNSIEKILEDMLNMFYTLINSYYYLGELFSGEN